MFSGFLLDYEQSEDPDILPESDKIILMKETYGLPKYYFFIRHSN